MKAFIRIYLGAFRVCIFLIVCRCSKKLYVRMRWYVDFQVDTDDERVLLFYPKACITSYRHMHIYNAHVQIHKQHYFAEGTVRERSFWLEGRICFVENTFQSFTAFTNTLRCPTKPWKFKIYLAFLRSENWNILITLKILYLWPKHEI